MRRDAKEICLKNNITGDDLWNISKRYLVKEGHDFRKFCINYIDFEDFSSKPFGFLGSHLKLTIGLGLANGDLNDDSHPNQNELKKLTFFVKIFPMANAGQADYVKEFQIFGKETELYQFLIPRLQDMAIGAKKWAAQSYLCKDEKVLILQDLRVEGFQVAINSKLGLFDLDHLLVAGTLLARFHASSLILENRNRETILQMYPNTLNENAYPDNESCVRMRGLENAIAVYQSLVPLIPKYQSDCRALEVINIELPIVMKRIVEYAKSSSQFRNLFSHGDLWANNILFLYENKGDKLGLLKPIDARLVDFQLSRYAPPALDLMTLVFMTSTKVFRQRYFKDICENYYESLRIELDRSGLDVNYELPKDQFWDSIEHYKLAGLIESLLFSHLTLLPEPQLEKMFANSNEFGQFILDANTRTTVCGECFNGDSEYRNRLTEIVTELIDTAVLELTPL